MIFDEPNQTKQSQQKAKHVQQAFASMSSNSATGWRLREKRHQLIPLEDLSEAAGLV